MCINDCNNLIDRDRFIYEEILIKSLGSPADLNKLVPSVESAYVLFRPRFRPRVSRLFLGDTITRATARVTSGACTRSCNPWKIINTRVTSPLSLSLPSDLRRQRSAELYVRSVRLVRNKWSRGTSRGMLFRYSSPSPTQACFNNAISFLGIFRLSSRGGTSLLMARLRETNSFSLFLMIVDWWRELEQKIRTCVIFYLSMYCVFLFKKFALKKRDEWAKCMLYLLRFYLAPIE